MYARLQQFDIAHRDMVRNRSFSPREAELERSWDSGETVVDLAQDDRLGSSGWGWGTKSAWTVIVSVHNMQVGGTGTCTAVPSGSRAVSVITCQPFGGYFFSQFGRFSVRAQESGRGYYEYEI